MQGIRSGTTRACSTSVGTLKIKGKIKFHETDKISKCRLSGPQSIETPTRRLKLDGDVWFHKNGRIKTICLNENLHDAGRIFMEGTIIGWDDKGDFLGEMVYDANHDDFVLRKDAWSRTNG